MKNHFVPRFYFKPWLDDRGHLFQFSRSRNSGLSVVAKTPAAICFRTDLHTFLDVTDPERRHAIEHWLSKQIDVYAAAITRQILSHGVASISAEQKSRLTHFILSLIIRKPETVEYLISNAPAELLRNMAIEDEKIRQEHGDLGLPTLAEYATKSRPGILENSGRFFIPELIGHREYGERLFALRWWAVDFSGTSIGPLLTSDRPVIWQSKSLGDPDAYYCLPLSPTVALYAAQQHVADKMLAQGNGILGLRTLQSTLIKCRQFVYGKRDTNRNMIERYLPRP